MSRSAAMTMTISRAHTTKAGNWQTGAHACQRGDDGVGATSSIIGTDRR